MPTTTIKLTPADHGRHMSLADFEFAEVQEGRIYELSRGVIVVSDVPNPRHLMQVNEIRFQFSGYWVLHRDKLNTIAAGSECKIPVEGLESERHPDIAIYKTPPPAADREVWRQWIPEIVIEIVSPDSEERDYVDKREEYLAFGVQEYWVVDAAREEVLILKRTSGRWKERILRPSEKYRTRLLPKFEFDCAAVFAAARAAETSE
jgi:Uma2 family endonuclease